jgi:hypothetical protein
MASSPKLTPSPSKEKAGSELYLRESDQYLHFSELLNNPLHSDVTFMVGQRRLNGHQPIINARCLELLTKGSVTKKKNIIEVHVPQDILPETFLDVLRYVYDNKVEIDKMQSLQLIQLLAATVYYEGLHRLKYICEDKIKKDLTSENVHRILKLVADYKLPIKDNVIYYCLENYNEFIGNKNAAKELGIDLFQDVVGAYQAKTAGQLKAPKELPMPPDTYVDDFKSMYDGGKWTDINFKLTEANQLGISGQIFKTHKAIIAGRAPGLGYICNQSSVEVSKNLSAVPLKGITPEAFEAMLKWLSYNEQKVPTMAACELIPFCKKHNMAGLLNCCVQSIKKGIDTESVLTILDVIHEKEMPDFFTEAAKELKPRCMDFCVQRMIDIDFEKIRQRKMNKKIAPDILLALQKRSQESR